MSAAFSPLHQSFISSKCCSSPSGPISCHQEAAAIWGCWMDVGEKQPVQGSLQGPQRPLNNNVGGEDTQNRPLVCGTHEHVKMLPGMGRCPPVNSAPVTRAGEVGYPRGSNPSVEAGEEAGGCCEWPDLCMATDNYSSFIICQAEEPGRAFTAHFWLPISAHKSLQCTAINQQGQREQGLGGRSCWPPTL